MSEKENISAKNPSPCYKFLQDLSVHIDREISISDKIITENRTKVFNAVQKTIEKNNLLIADSDAMIMEMNLRLIELSSGLETVKDNEVTYLPKLESERGELKLKV